MGHCKYDWALIGPIINEHYHLNSAIGCQKMIRDATGVEVSIGSIRDYATKHGIHVAPDVVKYLRTRHKTVTEIARRVRAEVVVKKYYATHGSGFCAKKRAESKKYINGIASQLGIKLNQATVKATCEGRIKTHINDMERAEMWHPARHGEKLWQLAAFKPWRKLKQSPRCTYMDNWPQ